MRRLEGAPGSRDTLAPAEKVGRSMPTQPRAQAVRPQGSVARVGPRAQAGESPAARGSAGEGLAVVQAAPWKMRAPARVARSRSIAERRAMHRLRTQRHPRRHRPAAPGLQSARAESRRSAGRRAKVSNRWIHRRVRQLRGRYLLPGSGGERHERSNQRVFEFAREVQGGLPAVQCFLCDGEGWLLRYERRNGPPGHVLFEEGGPRAVSR